MRIHRLTICLCLLVVNLACHKRREIEAGEDPVARIPKPGITDPTPVIPVTNSEWRKGSPTALVGNWASSLFQDQRCTAFYTFTQTELAELNLICLNAEKKQFEREFRRFKVAEYPGTQQVRLQQVVSSCPDSDPKGIASAGAAFLYALEATPTLDQGLRLAIWEPNVNKQPLNLSKSDGIMVEGFPNKTGTYLGMPIVSGCFTDGLVANFQVDPTASVP